MCNHSPVVFTKMLHLSSIICTKTFISSLDGSQDHCHSHHTNFFNTALFTIL